MDSAWPSNAGVHEEILYVGWTDAEVWVLIGFWGDTRIQSVLDGAVKNKVIFKKTARKMVEAGFHRELDTMQSEDQESKE